MKKRVFKPRVLYKFYTKAGVDIIWKIKSNKDCSYNYLYDDEWYYSGNGDTRLIKLTKEKYVEINANQIPILRQSYNIRMRALEAAEAAEAHSSDYSEDSEDELTFN